jgi:RecB family endonuclease NucS
VIFVLRRGRVSIATSCESHYIDRIASNLEPNLRLLNLQLQRQHCSKVERFSKKKKIILFSKRARLSVAL